MAPSKDIGAIITVDLSIPINNVDASSDVEGLSVPRYLDKTNDLGAPALSAVVVCSTGAASGSPSAQSHTFVVQESSDESTWTAVSGATLVIESDNTEGTLNLDLTEREGYLRVLYDSSASSFTGGSTPANDVHATIILSGYGETPVS